MQQLRLERDAVVRTETRLERRALRSDQLQRLLAQDLDVLGREELLNGHI